MANKTLCIAVIFALCMSYASAAPSGPYFKIKVHRVDDQAEFEFSATKMADYIYNSAIEATEACRNMESSENTVCQNICGNGKVSFLKQLIVKKKIEWPYFIFLGVSLYLFCSWIDLNTR